ncbi:CPBP family intramembrane glutamic endopeptidase [Ureibacillus massiliensis]|nr:type II CAAX endopeptidase family protein [Ureibacillus massiliensis]
MSHKNNGKTQKTAFYILLVYIACQLSSLLLLIPTVRDLFLNYIGNDTVAIYSLTAWWSTIAFAIAFVISIILILKNKNFWNIFKGEKASVGGAILWGILGFFLVLFGQMVGANIEVAIGIDYGSENTETLLRVTEIAPIMILSTVLLGPFLEELIFRRVVFGSLVQTQNFWIAGIISSIVFGAIHLDFTHIILYTISGFIFAFLYYKTKRLLTSIIAHTMLNGFVVITQLNYETLKEMQNALQFFIFIQ